MTNLSIVGQGEVGENQVTRSNVAKTQQPDAERLKTGIRPTRMVDASFDAEYQVILWFD